MTTKINFTVHHHEIDHLNIVHHSNYPKWFERGRMDHLEKIGISDGKVRAMGFFLPLSELECEFKSPARYKDEIIIHTKIAYLSCVKVKFEYQVLNGRNRNLLATGKTVHVWTNASIQPLNIEKTAPEIYHLLKKSAESKDMM